MRALLPPAWIWISRSSHPTYRRAGGSGIYDKLIPILQQWNRQDDFTGSFYVNIGDNPTGPDRTATNWAKILPYYQAIEAMGARSALTPTLT